MKELRRKKKTHTQPDSFAAECIAVESLFSTDYIDISKYLTHIVIISTNHKRALSNYGNGQSRNRFLRFHSNSQRPNQLHKCRRCVFYRFPDVNCSNTSIVRRLYLKTKDWTSVGPWTPRKLMAPRDGIIYSFSFTRDAYLPASSSQVILMYGLFWTAIQLELEEHLIKLTSLTNTIHFSGNRHWTWNRRSNLVTDSWHVHSRVPLRRQ